MKTAWAPGVMLAWMLLMASGLSAFAEDTVDLELVLAVDVSLSMDLEEQRLQRDGYVAAFRDPRVLKAIQGGTLGRIAVTYVEWAGPASQQTVLGWSLIDGPRTAEDFATKLAAIPISRFRMTSISMALAYAGREFNKSPYRGERRVIDISGDGPNNSGPPVARVRDELIAAGIVINGLPVIVRPSQSSVFDLTYLDEYYAQCVIGGPGSFMVQIRDKAEFVEAIRQKLILEISGLEPKAPIWRAQFKPEGAKIDCLVGEMMWQRYMDDRGRQ
jgi:hypothetical protein